MKVIGYKETSFTAKDTGASIRGLTLFVTYADERVNGLRCEVLYISERKRGGFVPKVGQEIDISWNRYGKVESVRAL